LGLEVGSFVASSVTNWLAMYIWPTLLVCWSVRIIYCNFAACLATVDGDFEVDIGRASGASRGLMWLVYIYSSDSN
jgi:hypothetical protein